LGCDAVLRPSYAFHTVCPSAKRKIDTKVSYLADQFEVVRQSFEFTMNKILFKVFGATSKDSYSYIYECFGIDNANQFIRIRQDKFINKFCASDDLLCRAIYGRQCGLEVTEDH